MTALYSVEVLSRDSAQVADIALSEDGEVWPEVDESFEEETLTPPEEESSPVRRIVQALIVNNIGDATESVIITLRHQKRHKINEPWRNADTFNLATLKAGQEVKIKLDASETWRLREVLNQLYGIGRDGTPQNSGDYISVPAEVLRNSIIVPCRDQVEEAMAYEESGSLPDAARRVIEQLHDAHGEQIWQALEEHNPGLLSFLAFKKQHEAHLAALSEFRAALTERPADEKYWQAFFERNIWIFGQALHFAFLHLLQREAECGGGDLSNHNKQMADYLLATGADVGFTVLVDIKTPAAPLVEAKQYRNGAHCIGHEVNGGVAQIQANCSRWDKEGSERCQNAVPLAAQNIVTCQPEGILIVGHTAQLDTDAKRTSFGLYRREMRSPKIITFDELLARAEYLVAGKK